MLAKVFYCQKKTEKKTMDTISPTQDALLQYSNRVAYQAGMWFTSLSSATPESYIVGGSDANITDYPYTCSLRYSGVHSCGCVILSSTKILTSAQCVDGREIHLFSVVAGQSDRRLGTPKALSDVHIHEEFNTGSFTLYNDLATGTFESPLDTSDPGIAAGIIAGAGDNFDGSSCHVTGWGRTNGSVPELPIILQVGNTTAIDAATCQAGVGLGYIGDGHICAQQNSTTICISDLGNPLWCGGKIAGIASWNIITNGVYRSDHPSVFVRLSHYQDWIEH
ncbi:fibrinolytic enzyme, isozyme C-like [Gigantopelta aegis]|uniref:fibrinolytic enzyme, isozyme C-like n=1 Tax=Gigantopelta aegis TaxID=1735272 RepID=UPI001B88DCD0|nr:fibrinolytic enzyme, isozyme C-like [Gigantopelta aegis]